MVVQGCRTACMAQSEAYRGREFFFSFFLRYFRDHDGLPGVPHCLRIFILFYFFFFRYGTIHLLWRVRVLLHPKDLYGIWNRCGDYTPAAFDCRQGNLSRDNEERTRERLLSSGIKPQGGET